MVLQLPGHKEESGRKRGGDGNRPARDQKLVSCPVNDTLLAPDIEHQGVTQNDVCGKVRQPGSGFAFPDNGRFCPYEPARSRFVGPGIGKVPDDDRRLRKGMGIRWNGPAVGYMPPRQESENKNGRKKRDQGDENDNGSPAQERQHNPGPAGSVPGHRSVAAPENKVLLGKIVEQALEGINPFGDRRGRLVELNGLVLRKGKLNDILKPLVS